jgi:hypothetical protein
MFLAAALLKFFGYSSVTQLAPISAVKTVLEEKSASGNIFFLTCLEERVQNNKWISVSAASSNCHWCE